MRHDPKKLVTLAVLAAGLMLGGCSGFNFSMPSYGSSTSSDAPPPPPGVGSGSGAMPSKYSSEELVGRWGFTSYQKEADRARTIATARGLCKSPYVIAKGPGGGVMMHLADERQPTELRLKGNAEGRNFIGPDGDAGVPQDREIVSFDGRVLVTRYVDPDAANRYGNMVYVRCSPKA
jgi:hypothetical protein